MGTELYEKKIRPLVEKGDKGRFIDIETGDFVVGDDSIEELEKMIAKSPDCQLWTVRIGHWAAGRLGYHGSTEIK